MKTLKRLLSTMLIAVTALSTITFSVFAAGENTEKVGLSVEGLKSQIFLKDDSVWVFPHPWNSSQYITNYTLYSTYLKSANGYTLRVTDENKNQITDQTKVNEPVTDGSFLRAVKENETIYFPLVEQAEENTGINQGFFAGYVPNAAYLNKDVKGAFGRSFDESAAVFTVPANAENQATSRMEYNIAGTLTEETAPITVEISFYVDGNAGAHILKDGGNSLVTVDKDGKCLYNKQGTMTEFPKVVTPGKWHRFAISIDKAKGDWSTVWIDGEKVTNVGQTWKGLPTQLRFGLTSDCGEGSVAYADPRAYYGYYNKTYDSVRIKSESGNLSVDTANKKISYNPENITTAEALTAAVLNITDAREAKVYTDSTRTALGYTENSVVEIVSKSMASREIYTLESSLTPMQKLGLEISDKYEEGFSWFGGTHEKDNIYVKKDNEKLYVFSSTENSYTAYAYRVLKTLTSVNGYTLSIVDENKNELSGLLMNDNGTEPVTGTREQDIVTKGCFLKGVKGADTVYIPIDNKIIRVSSQDLSAIGGHNWQTDVAAVSNEGGIAGKAANDVAYVMTAGTTATSKIAKLQIDSDECKKYYTGGVYTYAVNVYADGDAIARIAAYDGNFIDAFNWKPNGKFTYNYDEKDTEGGTAERGKWHRIAITYDLHRGRLHFWVDGKHITNKSKWLSNLTRIDLAIDQGSSNGKVAYDDFTIYEGYYDPAEDMVDVTSQNTSAYDGNISYTDEITTLAALKTDMGVDNISFYTDSALAEKATDLSNAKYALAISESGAGLNYFNVAKVSKADMLVSKVENGIFTVKALYKAAEGTQLNIAAYNKQTGKLESVNQYKTGSDGIAEFTGKMSDETIQKAFLWDNYMKPIAKATSAEN